MEGGLEEARNASLKHSEILLKQAADSLARLRANPDASAQGAPLFDQMLAAYAAFADQTLAPMQKAIQGWNGIEVNRLVDKVLPGSGSAYVRQAEAYQACAPARRGGGGRRQRYPGQGHPGGGGGVGLVVVLAVLIRLAFRRGILRPLNEAGAHFDRIADGDLTGAIALRGDNEIGVLYSAMRRMQAGLTEAVASVPTASRKSIPARARSPRAAPTCPTAPRAGRLIAGSAANMTQLAHTVLTAGNADQASRQAQSATQLAQRGGQAVDEWCRACGIADSARRIGEIVGVVDSIAFQTNILALNAAVEARAPASRARASPWWRARCVRWRSAARRRQGNQGLIDDSAARVEAGVRQVGLAGDTMRDMMVSVDRVTQIVAEISSATAEQAAGIASVNLAVADVERSTQENAAMVEQTAAAAAALESQAQALRRAVAVFQIAEGVGEARQASAAGELRQGSAAIALAHQRQVPMLDLCLTCAAADAMSSGRMRSHREGVTVSAPRRGSRRGRSAARRSGPRPRCRRCGGLRRRRGPWRGR